MIWTWPPVVQTALMFIFLKCSYTINMIRLLLRSFLPLYTHTHTHTLKSHTHISYVFPQSPCCSAPRCHTLLTVICETSTVKPPTLPIGRIPLQESAPLSSHHRLDSSLKERGISLLISARLSCRQSSYYCLLLARVFQEPKEHLANQPLTVTPSYSV